MKKTFSQILEEISPDRRPLLMELMEGALKELRFQCVTNPGALQALALIEQMVEGGARKPEEEEDEPVVPPEQQ